ncbi:MAG: hypothetical protein K0R34_973 [Herbinix sp.]|jgi:hypothetical protein|nr:hypothetical protein [Herbinix sp.]
MLNQQFGPLGPIYIASSLINAGTNLLNGHFSRVQQDRIAEENRSMTLRLEADRQNFQLDMFRKNAELQDTLSTERHNFALKEIQMNFENMCKSAEWHLFLEKWPLVTLPCVVREAQVLMDNTVSLRIIFSHNNDTIFNTSVYPYVEQQLREFIDLYSNRFGSKNLIYYHKGFSSQLHGGALEENIHYALKEIPVMIIDANVLPGEIILSATIWGFGSTEKKHCTVFHLPYDKKILDNKLDQEYYRELSERLLAHVKYIVGYTYDTYNLVEYNRPPLLGKIASYEMEYQCKGNILEYLDRSAYLGNEYVKLFELVFNTEELNMAKAYQLPQLQLDFAEAIQEYVSPEQLLEMLNCSLASWTLQRTTVDSDIFLQQLRENENITSRYIDECEARYLKKLAMNYLKVRCTEGDLTSERILYIVKRAENIADIEDIPDQSKRDQLPVKEDEQGNVMVSKRRRIEL